MYTITIAQNKGGDGKTTVARLLGEWAGRQKLRTLMIDCDPQANLSQRFLKMDNDPNETDGVLPPVHPDWSPDDRDWISGRSSMVDIFQARPTYPYPTKNPYIDIIPAYGHDMRRLELQRADEVREKIYDRMRLWLAGEDVRNAYDLAIIDTPPAKSPLVISAVRAATHLLVPTQMEQQSIEGLRGMTQLWRRENRAIGEGQKIELVGILANKFRPTVSMQKGFLEMHRENPAYRHYLIPHVLTLRADFAETDHPEAKPKSVFDLGPAKAARKEATEACRWIFDKIGLTALAEQQQAVRA